MSPPFEQQNGEPLDVLADVLANTRIGTSILGGGEIETPWGMQFDSGSRAKFHMVRRGSCWLKMDGVDPIRLLQGDVVLLPKGAAHALSDSRDTPALPYRQVTWSCGRREAGDDDIGTYTAMLCGAYDFEQEGPHPLLSLLPAVIHIRADEAQADGALQPALQILMGELCKRPPGAEAVISRLLDVVFILVTRIWLERQPKCSAGWLGALRDPKIGLALSLIHAEPQRRWTVEILAERLAMSRAAFAKRFVDYVGEPPLAYLTRWRMDTAARFLRESQWPLVIVAEKVGYESEAAFGKAFRRVRGVAPGRYRGRHSGRLPAIAEA